LLQEIALYGIDWKFIENCFIFLRLLEPLSRSCNILFFLSWYFNKRGGLQSLSPMSHARYIDDISH